MSKKLILVRHGESLWNNQNKFTGWANIGLTELGKNQAINSGKILLKNNILPTISYTSELKEVLIQTIYYLNNLI